MAKAEVLTLHAQLLPNLLKDAVLVTVPNFGYPKTLNASRPVARTTAVMKILVKLVKTELLRKTEYVL